jgi:hypothetical protein
MPVDLQIIRAAEFLRLGAEGEFDLVASCAMLEELIRTCRQRGIHRALVDIRQARGKLGPTDLAAMVNTFREIGFTRNQWLAVLHSGDPFHRARMFAFISRMRGWKVQAFGDYGEAITWLSSAEEPAARARARRLARRVPVAGLAREQAQEDSIEKAPVPVRRNTRRHHVLRVNRQR